MKVFRAFIFFILIISFITIQISSKELYVSKYTGNNGNPGTKSKPLKNLDKALRIASMGDIIKVAQGNYFGLRNKGYLEAQSPVKIYGGYSDNFSKRDILRLKSMPS